MREAQAAGHEVRFFTSGKKAQSTIRFRGLPLAQAWTGFSETPSYSDAQAIAHAIAEAYVEGTVDRVTLVYNAFVSPLVQRVTVIEVLPVSTEALGAQEAEQPRASRSGPIGLLLRARAAADPRAAAAGLRRDRSSTGRSSSRPPPSRAPA